jgi:hypothetical protein
VKRPKVRGKLVYIGTLLAVAAFAGGYGMAVAALTITQGAAENGAGNYAAAGSISGWSQTSDGFSLTPSTAPAQLSSTVGTPTPLAAAGQSYGINAQTPGDVAHYFVFQEATGVTANEEIELTFTVTGSGSASIGTPVKVYVETQSPLPTLPQSYTLYYDLGSPSGGTITINSVEQVSLQCSSPGTCP